MRFLTGGIEGTDFEAIFGRLTKTTGKTYLLAQTGFDLFLPFQETGFADIRGPHGLPSASSYSWGVRRLFEFGHPIG